MKVEEEKIAFQKLNAFRVFKIEGEEKARKKYPEWINFVLDNKDKTLEEIEKELLHAKASH